MNILSGSHLATEAMRRELMTDYDERAGALKDKELKFDYLKVAKVCRVIDSNTKIVVVSPAIIRALEQREKIEHKELLRHSVQLWPKKINIFLLKRCINVLGYTKCLKVIMEDFSRVQTDHVLAI